MLIASTNFIDDTTLTLEITSHAGAQAASYDLILTNPNGQEGTLTGALQVVLPPDPDEPNTGGCGCSATSGTSAGGGASLLGFLLIWLLIDWRRPRRPHRGRPR